MCLQRRQELCWICGVWVNILNFFAHSDGSTTFLSDFWILLKIHHTEGLPKAHQDAHPEVSTWNAVFGDTSQIFSVWLWYKHTCPLKKCRQACQILTIWCTDCKSHIVASYNRNYIYLPLSLLNKWSDLEWLNIARMKLSLNSIEVVIVVWQVVDTMDTLLHFIL